MLILKEEDDTVDTLLERINQLPPEKKERVYDYVFEKKSLWESLTAAELPIFIALYPKRIWGYIYFFITKSITFLARR